MLEISWELLLGYIWHYSQSIAKHWVWRPAYYVIYSNTGSGSTGHQQKTADSFPSAFYHNSPFPPHKRWALSLVSLFDCICFSSSMPVNHSGAKVEVAPTGVTTQIGEGPHWEEDTGRLLFVDVTANKLYRWHGASGKLETKEFGKL